MADYEGRTDPRPCRDVFHQLLPFVSLDLRYTALTGKKSCAEPYDLYQKRFRLDTDRLMILVADHLFRDTGNPFLNALDVLLL